MLINVIKRDGTTELRYIEPGYMLAGLRITSLVIEGPRELAKLTTPEVQLWLKRNVTHCFTPDNKD